MSDDELTPLGEPEFLPVTDEEQQRAQDRIAEIVARYRGFEKLDPETQKLLAADSEKYNFPIGFRSSTDGHDHGRGAPGR